MEFWLEKGVNGFRVDTVNLYSKDMSFPDAPIVDPNSFIQPAGNLFSNGPEMHKYLKEMGAIFDRYDAMTVGELPNTPDVARVKEYVSLANKELSMVFQFDGVDLGRRPSNTFALQPYKLTDLKRITEKWQTFIEHTDSWTTAFIENHDQGRSISRFADDSEAHREASSKMMALFTLCQTGTPYIYQGQELGMTNVPADWPESEYLDVNTINYLQKARDEGVSEDTIKAKLWPDIRRVARDNARTPVQWSDAQYAGFSTAKPWMRVNDNYKSINAAKQLKDKDSVFHFWQRAVSLRKQHMDIFTYGTFALHDGDNESVFAFVKTAQSGQKAVVLLNFGTQSQPISLPDGLQVGAVQSVLSTRTLADNHESLEAYEGRVYVF